MERTDEKMELDIKLEQDIRDCKKKAELLETFLTMLVKGFISEY